MSNSNGMNGTQHERALSVDPREVARAALMFLGRADFKRHERQTFDMAEAMLSAIIEGQLVVTQRDPKTPVEMPALASSDAPPLQ